MLSRVRLFETPWIAACQAPLFMGFSRQEYWSGLPFLSAGDLGDPRMEPGLPHCGQILYSLSHQGSPSKIKAFSNSKLRLIKTLPRVKSSVRKLKGWAICRGFWESHFLGRLIRSLGVPKERGVWNSQGGRKDKLFSLFFPWDYITIMYPAWGQSLG